MPMYTPHENNRIRNDGLETKARMPCSVDMRRTLADAVGALAGRSGKLTSAATKTATQAAVWTYSSVKMSSG